MESACHCEDRKTEERRMPFRMGVVVVDKSGLIAESQTPDRIGPGVQHEYWAVAVTPTDTGAPGKCLLILLDQKHPPLCLCLPVFLHFSDCGRCTALLHFGGGWGLVSQALPNSTTAKWTVTQPSRTSLRSHWNSSQTLWKEAYIFSEMKVPC